MNIKHFGPNIKSRDIKDQFLNHGVWKKDVLKLKKILNMAFHQTIFLGQHGKNWETKTVDKILEILKLTGRYWYRTAWMFSAVDFEMLILSFISADIVLLRRRVSIRSCWSNRWPSLLCRSRSDFFSNSRIVAVSRASDSKFSRFCSSSKGFSWWYYNSCYKIFLSGTITRRPATTGIFSALQLVENCSKIKLIYDEKEA